MLEIATHVRDGQQILPLDQARREALQALAAQYNEDGFRVLVLATRDLGEQKNALPS
jgi:P-type Mg2+ transporter